MRVCILGGTTEGRLLAKFLGDLGVKVDLYVATDYGEQFVKELENVKVHQKRLDKEQMVELFNESGFDYVADATHPFAEVVSKNAKGAATLSNTKYYRIVRESNKSDNGIYFECMDYIIKYLNHTDGNILLTSGSKDLDKFTRVNNYQQRIFVRILPMESSLKRALELEYSNKNVICMQGPFSEELNIAMINAIEAKFLVTKESSASGGFHDKVNACVKTNTKCLVLKKPEEHGVTLENFKQIIRGNV